jgi:hypothetical protein
MKTRTLKRKVNPVPAKIKTLMNEEGVWVAYQHRPPYQRNDYMGWINKAKLDVTKEKRTRQMIEELKKGNVYMKMKWSPR